MVNSNLIFYSIDSFIVNTKTDLGEVFLVSVGHDNSAFIGNPWLLEKVNKNNSFFVLVIFFTATSLFLSQKRIPKGISDAINS